MTTQNNIQAGERTQHTPGPWRTLEENAYRSPLVEMDAAESRPIAEIRGDGRDERLANARLIAAAPELLEACKLVSNNWSYAEKGTPLAAILDAVRSAIGKANGQS